MIFNLRTRSLVLSFLFVACGGTSESELQPLQFEFPLTKADCPVLPTSPTIRARLIVATCESSGTPSNDPLLAPFDCDANQQPVLVTTCTDFKVETSATSGAISVTGDCPKIPARQVQLALQWFVTSPGLNKDILLAEQVGPLNLSNSKAQVRIVEFKQPKTKGLAGDSEAEKNRFNCDRTGVSSCDSNDVPASSGGTDVDSCSNLEELCLNPPRLFNGGAPDSCP